ncbi:24970_t:CDS:1, partial [Gigaspora margarita]
MEVLVVVIPLTAFKKTFLLLEDPFVIRDEGIKVRGKESKHENVVVRNE